VPDNFPIPSAPLDYDVDVVQDYYRQNDQAIRLPDDVLTGIYLAGLLRTATGCQPYPRDEAAIKSVRLIPGAATQREPYDCGVPIHA
jgi:hypothetical protein